MQLISEQQIRVEASKYRKISQTGKIEFYISELSEFVNSFIVNGEAENKSSDKNVEANRELLLQRSNFGIEKYGVTTDNAKLTHRQWLQHSLEECLDMANYLQAAIQTMKGE